MSESSLTCARKLADSSNANGASLETGAIPSSLTDTGRSSKPMATESYDEFLQKELQEPEMAAEYLSAALEEGSMDQFLLALRNVADTSW